MRAASDAVADNAGNTSTAVPATIASPTTSVRRASSMREFITCRPLIMTNVTANSSEATTTGRGITARSTVNFGKRPSSTNMTATA
ncbi:hypothetical protein D3C83_157640 [compost metagenome]